MASSSGNASVTEYNNPYCDGGMRMNTLFRQRGLSIWELLFYSVLIGIAALVVIKVFPLYMEKFKVVKAMKTIAEASDIRNLGEPDIKDRLLRHFEIEDVDRFS